MLKIYLRKNTNRDAKGYGRYYAFADNEKPVTLEGLADYMANHRTPFSKGTIVGILKDMVGCIREMNLNGQPVKIDGLAIFSTHIENRGGWAALKDVSLTVGGEADNIQALRLCAQATGDFSKAELTKYGSVLLNREWRQKVQDAKKESGIIEPDPADPTPSPATGGNTGGGNDTIDGPNGD